MWCTRITLSHGHLLFGGAVLGASYVTLPCLTLAGELSQSNSC
jgi:hypothetical protein